MAPTISTALIMTVLFTAFIMFSRTTLDNNLEISQAMNEAAELAGAVAVIIFDSKERPLVQMAGNAPHLRLPARITACLP